MTRGGRRLVLPHLADTEISIRAAPGLIRADDSVVRAFAEAGWIWGGSWSSGSDLLHFSTNGR